MRIDLIYELPRNRFSIAVAALTAAGAFKPRLYVIPSRQMVVVRFGNSVGPQFDAARFLGLLAGSLRD